MGWGTYVFLQNMEDRKGVYFFVSRQTESDIKEWLKENLVEKMLTQFSENEQIDDIMYSSAEELLREKPLIWLLNVIKYFVEIYNVHTQLNMYRLLIDILRFYGYEEVQVITESEFDEFIKQYKDNRHDHWEILEL